MQSEAAAIRSAIGEIQQFYADSLGGSTFRLNDLEVVQGNGPKEDYHIIWNGNNIYEDGVEFDGNMEAAVVEELSARGYPSAPNLDLDGYSALVFVKGAGGYAGAREFDNADGGWGILGTSASIVCKAMCPRSPTGGPVAISKLALPPTSPRSRCCRTPCSRCNIRSPSNSSTRDTGQQTTVVLTFSEAPNETGIGTISSHAASSNEVFLGSNQHHFASRWMQAFLVGKNYWRLPEVGV